jgi:RimJ/RimL family protein N-acetyltransferase
MTTKLFIGQKIRLTAPDPEKDAAAMASWSRDGEFLRLLSSGVARPWTVSATKKELEDNIGLNRDEPKSRQFAFLIRTLEAEGQPTRLVGLVDLVVVQWPHRDAYIGIGIGERADWGKGYGSDAMRLILRYAFDELNLHRVTLTVFEYNERAIHTYRKLGFQEEGRQRQRLRRDGRLWDMLVMGLLREEWKSE